MLSGSGAGRVRPIHVSGLGGSWGARARSWIHRVVAIAFVASSLAPLVEARPAAATSAPVSTGDVRAQAQVPPKPAVATK